MNKINILIVEDDNSVIEPIKKRITKVFSEFDDLEPILIEMVEILEREKVKLEMENFDIAIIDYELEGQEINGFEVIEEIRNKNIFFNPKVIVFTGKAVKRDDILRAFNSGQIFAYIEKPNIDALENSIKRACEDIIKEKRLKAISLISDKKLRKFILKDYGWKNLESGISTKMAFMFCDISNSSEFLMTWLQGGARQHRIAEFLRYLFAEISLVINRYNGTIDKYIGDEVMAYFVDPEEQKSAEELCLAALNACCEIRNSFPRWITEANYRWGECGFPNIDKININIKSVIHYGRVIWGALGTNDYYDISILTKEVIKAARIMQHQIDIKKSKRRFREVSQKLVGPGDIVITGEVKSNVHSKDFNIEEYEKIELRNFPDYIIPVYKVK